MMSAFLYVCSSAPKLTKSRTFLPIVSHLSRKGEPSMFLARGPPASRLIVYRSFYSIFCSVHRFIRCPVAAFLTPRKLWMDTHSCRFSSIYQHFLPPSLSAAFFHHF